MTRSRDIADSTKTLDVDGGTIKLDGNYPTGTGNVALGDTALDSVQSSGTYNTAIGHNALTANTTATNNVSVGAFSLALNTTGEANTAVGLAALDANTTGSNNVGLGRDALSSNTTASNNTAVGYLAGFANTTGISNTFLGKEAGRNSTANGNTFLGVDSGYNVTSGANNTILGRYNGNQHSLDIRTSSNMIVLSDGDGKPHLKCFSDGRWYFGLSTTGNGHINLVGEFGSSYKAIEFQRTNGGSSVGSIVTNTSSTSYNTSSDHRLKENVDYTWDATTRLKLLKPARFNFIADGTDTVVDGFLAHEAQAVVPEAVTGTHNEVDEDGVAVMQGIDQSKLVPLLVKTIQELEARITALEA